MVVPRAVKANARIRKKAFREAEQLPLIRVTDLQKTRKMEDKTISRHLATDGHCNNHAQGPNEGQRRKKEESDRSAEPCVG